jgi:hypothetical protein
MGKRILPAVERNVNNTPMTVAFVTKLFEAGANGEVPEDVADTVYRDVVSDLADSFSLRSLGTTLAAKQKEAISRAWGRSNDLEPIIDHENSKNIATLLCQCHLLELTRELDEIVEKISAEARTIKIELFEGVYLPLLKTLVGLLQTQNISLDDSQFQKGFKFILAAYIVRYVEEEPAAPKDWARAPVDCECEHCIPLNAFLVNPLEEVGSFPGAQNWHQFNLIGDVGFIRETVDKYKPTEALKVTKTLGQYDAAHKEWTRRRDAAKKHLKSFQKENIKALLGKMHGPIMSLKVSKVEPFMKPTLPAPALNEDASKENLPPAKKRKVTSKLAAKVDG